MTSVTRKIWYSRIDSAMSIEFATETAASDDIQVCQKSQVKCSPSKNMTNAALLARQNYYRRLDTRAATASAGTSNLVDTMNSAANLFGLTPRHTQARTQVPMVREDRPTNGNAVVD